MADAVGTVTTIVEVALKIKEAVDTVKQNRKDCHHIKSRVERVRHILSLCENNTELMEHSAVSAALEALGEVLGEALKLVTDCQEETNAMCLCCTAGKLSKQLSKVDQDISNINSEATFAILVYHISKQTPPPPLVECHFGTEEEQGFAMEQGEHDEYIENSLVQPRTLLQQIAEVALKVKAAVETVRQNKEDCVEITRRVSRASALLARFEDTETMKDAAMSAALEKLLETFRRARTVVTACQRRGIIVSLCLPCQPGTLSNELRQVLDQMVLDLDVLIDTLPTARD